MNKPRLSLRRRPVVKAPPPGVRLEGAPPRSGSLRVETIVERMRPSQQSGEINLEQREAVLARAERTVVEREQSLRLREAAVVEREREALETITLAEAREVRAIQHEAVLEANRDNLERAATLTRLQAEITQLRKEKQAWTAALAEAHADLNELEKELAAVTPQTSSHPVDSPRTEPPAETGTTKLLAEREAFIEESENTLFQRAQELQELEMHLQQWQEELNHRADEMGLMDSAPSSLILADDPAQKEDTLIGLDPSH